KVTVNTTVQAYNVLRLADLCEAMFTIRAPQFHVYPRLSLLYHSPAFSIQVLPAELKELAASRLRAFIARWDGRWPDAPDGGLERFLHGIDGVIEHLFAADRGDRLPEFVRRTLGFDRMRDQDVRAVLPELAPLFAGV